MSANGDIAIGKFNFTARKETELSFEVGDVIVLVNPPQPTEGWLCGHLLRDDEDGTAVSNAYFPSNYVDVISAGKETYVFAVALYDFTGRNEMELTLHAGDSLSLINPDYQSSWITAQCHGRRGVVPADYVELAEYCDDDEAYDEEAAEGEEIPPPEEGEEDIPPPVEQEEIAPPPRMVSSQSIVKLNVIRTLRRGTIDEGQAYSDDVPPPVPRPQRSKPKASFVVSAPPASMSQKYSRANEETNDPNAPPIPRSNPAVATSAPADNNPFNKRLSLPPVSSQTDLFSLLESQEKALEAAKNAEDAAIQDFSSESDAAFKGFSSAQRSSGASKPVAASSKESSGSFELDAETDAKLAALASIKFDLGPEEESAPKVPTTSSEPAVKSNKRGKRYSMLLPTDMNSAFEEKLKTEGSNMVREASALQLGVDDCYLFEEADMPENIQYKSNGEMAGANFMKMMAYLTKPSGKAESQRMSDIRSFVECFRMFCTPEQFFEKLRMRFLTISDGSAIVQRNCIELLNAWSQTAFAVDLAPNKALYDQVQSFLESIAKACDNMSPVVCQAARHVEQVNKLLLNPVVLPEEAILRPEQYAQEPVPHASAFLKASASDIAHQLSLIQHSMLMRVCPVELIRDVWMADSAETLAPNLTAHVDFCNQKTLWLQELVVSAKKDSERKKVIAHIVECAEQCLAVNNFNGMMIFLSAVQSRNVKPFDKLLSSKAREKLEQTLLPLIANDCRQLRTIQEVRSPGIPYVDTWLADMAVLNRDNPDKLPGTKLINWSKIQILGMSLRRLQNFQHEKGYTFAPKRSVIALIHAMKPSMKEEQVFALAESLLQKKK